MEKAGKIWPHELDRSPQTATFWVPRSSLTAGEEYIPGSARVEVAEMPIDVECRLCEQFPLYKVVKMLENAIRRSER
jgi:hypothetical protein